MSEKKEKKEDGLINTSEPLYPDYKSKEDFEEKNEPEIIIGNVTKILDIIEENKQMKLELKKLKEPKSIPIGKEGKWIYIYKYKRINCPCSQEYINRINCHYCEFNSKIQNEDYIYCNYSIK